MDAEKFDDIRRRVRKHVGGKPNSELDRLLETLSTEPLSANQISRLLNEVPRDATDTRQKTLRDALERRLIETRDAEKVIAENLRQEQSQTLVDRIIRKFKNHPICAPLIVAFLILSATLPFLTSFRALFRHATIVQFEVSASKADWQISPVTLRPDEQAEISAKGEWGIIDPKKRGLCGAGGNGIKAGKGFQHEGGREGSLLVRVGNMLQEFGSDGKPVLVAGPGKIEFIANDNKYDDNTGIMRATIKVIRR